MRIAISGTACQGKTTLIKDFLGQWPNYVTPKKTYRDIIKDNDLDHSSKTNKKTQWEILNFQTCPRCRKQILRIKLAIPQKHFIIWRLVRGSLL